MDTEKIERYISRGEKVHMVGIGGVSMRALAEVLREGGALVTGSDMRESEATKRLKALGVTVHIGHDGKNIGEAGCVIRTAAVHDDNPEIAAARKAGVPVFERAEVWGAIMKGYRTAICISRCGPAGTPPS